VNATGLEYVKLAAAGEYFFYVQLWNGSLLSAGKNSDGQCGLGFDNDTIGVPTLVPIEKLDLKQIAAGDDHALLVLQNGSVLGVGENTDGQLGLGSNASVSSLTMLPVQNVSSAAGGEDNSYLVLHNGTVLAAGDNTYGQLGNGSNGSGYTIHFQQMSMPGPAHSADAGDDVVLVLLYNGSVFAAGRNDYGQLGIGNDFEPQSSPKKVPVESARAIATGNYFSVALHSTDAYAWGDNRYGQLGIGLGNRSQCMGGSNTTSPENCSSPVHIKLPSGMYLQGVSANIGPDSEHALYLFQELA